ncbi:MAG: protein kinase [Acidobacteriota bacterium]
MRDNLQKTKKINSKNIEIRTNTTGIIRGQIINSRYRIIENIGSGGFGNVFRAEDILLKKDVALKFLDSGIRKDRKKFIRVKREINTSQKISDERIVKIFDLDYINDTPFLIMEYIKGENFKKYLKRKGPLSWKEFRPLYLEILKGVRSLHEKNIIHRDLKPSNIIVTAEEKIKIIDFGLSKELGDKEKTSSVGEMIGSPRYMSPEQIKGGDIDCFSDIYQMGLILYYFLSPAKEDAHNSSTIEQLLSRINLDPRKNYNPGTKIPGFLKFGIFKALESDKKQRFRSVEEMIRYFNSGKISFLTLISNYFRRNKRAVFTLLAVIVFLSTLSFLYFKGSRIISGININGSEITVSNRFGVKLFKKNFSPMKIRNAIPLKINSNFRRLRQRVNKDTYLMKDPQTAAVFLSKDNLYKEIVDLSIESEKFSSKVSLFDCSGNKICTQLFHMKNDFLRRSLFSGWMDFSDISSNDLDGDGENEIHFFVYQNMSMFPSGFCIIDNQDFHVVYNQGHIEKYFFYKGDKNENRVLLIGMSNLFSHFRFICDININEISNIQLPPFLNKNLNRVILKYSYMLIPHRSEIIRNDWKKGGVIAFKSHSSNTVFELNRNWDLSISNEKGIKVYKDEHQKISDMIYFLSLAYQKKILKKGDFDSVKEAKRLMDLNMSNPVFKSLINYYAGDIYMSSGHYSDAEKYFEISKKIIPENYDPDQKIAELYFLSGRNNKLWDKLEKKSTEFSKFFGLGEFGIKLFKIYVHLNSGEFRVASDLSGSYKKAENFLKGMIFLFKGDYRSSLSETLKLIGARTTPFTLSEARLLYSRSVLLNYIFNKKGDSVDSEDLKLAEFYLNDLAVNSLLDGHLARISRAYFMALKGDTRNAVEYADETLEKLLMDSKGDMFTKLWLFYDAFIYAKIMERTGNSEKAIEGYKISFRSNPYTDLAENAREKLNYLKK